MSCDLIEFSQKFRLADLTIARFAHWTWSVRPAHPTLGAGVLSLNRFCTGFGAITEQEAAELAMITCEIERKLGVLFHPDKFNYLMLMMIDVHVHFHVIPRYAQPRQFDGIEWTDKGWPSFPSLTDGAAFADAPVLFKLRDALKNA